MTGYNTDQIKDYIDVSNTSGAQSSNPNMILAAGKPVTIKGRSSMTAKSDVASLMNTGNQYWLASRFTNTWYDPNGGKTAYSEDIVHERYDFSYVRTDGVFTDFYSLFDVYGYNTYGSNGSFNCALRPVITVSGDLIKDKSIGAKVSTDPFYKGKTGAEAHGYIRADSLSSLLGVDIKGMSKIDAGLPVPESDMTWTQLKDGGYNSADSATGSFDKSKYDYYIADRTTKLQVRLTGAQGYNNGVLALDTICNDIYGGETSIKLSNGKTKNVKVKQARNAKFEDFWDESKIGKSTTSGYGATYSTDSSKASSIASGSTDSVITSNWNRYTPTIFGYEDINSSIPSSGYSDAKISSYNLQANNKYYNGDTSKSNLAEDKRKDYAAEKRYPDMTVMYNALWGTGANRNTAVSTKTSNSQNYWLSSRCVIADWYSAYFRLRCVSGDGSLITGDVFYSDTGVYSASCGLRPVLVVEK
jgi:hypothetical protein